MDPKKIFIKDYTYSLPEERIAVYPLPERDASKLLIYSNGKIAEDIYKNLADHLPANSFLLFNNTKVIEARILFQKPTGGMVEIFCLEPHENYFDITTAMLQHEKVLWRCLIGGASKWKAGQILQKKIDHGIEEIILQASYIKKLQESFVIELSWKPTGLSFAEVLHKAGAVPLPPYIKRKPEKNDAERYQTVYAHYEGSVAAPTAGLHFTNEILNELNLKNVETDFITLHVGAGTFKLIKEDTLDRHEMHAEFFTVSISTIEKIIANLNNNIIAVGTTSLRTLESLYWLGVKATLNPDIKIHELNLTQWEVYGLEQQSHKVEDALNALLNRMKQNKLEQLFAKTQIIIVPGYKTKIPKTLITNFHQPQSTLLLLVAALIGDDWKKVYQYAIANGFRFLSYGDGSLLWIPPSPG